MRFEPASFLLGLAALGNLQAGSARVLYGYTGNDELTNPTHNVTNVERAVVVPVKPVTPVKPIPDAPEPIVPGGDRSPTTPGDTTPDNEPAPLVPSDKTPNAPGDKPNEPAPLVPGDKTPTTGDRDSSTASDIDKELDLWCPAESVVTKRALVARARERCSRRRTDRSGDELHNYLSERGRRADRLIRNREYSTTDYESRLDNYYEVERSPSPDQSAIRNTFQRTGYDREHGFEDTSNFQTYTTYSSGNQDLPVVRASFGRSSRDPEHASYLAHWRYAERDANRYQLGNDGRPRFNDDDTYQLANDHENRAVPASQILGSSARRSGVLRGPTRRLSLVSDNIVGPESRRAFDDAFSDLSGSSRGNGWINLRSDSTGLEARHYERMMGVDNHNSYIHTVGHDRAYDGFVPSDIDIFRQDSGANRYYASSLNFNRR